MLSQRNFFCCEGEGQYECLIVGLLCDVEIILVIYLECWVVLD